MACTSEIAAMSGSERRSLAGAPESRGKMWTFYLLLGLPAAALLAAELFLGRDSYASRFLANYRRHNQDSTSRAL